MEISDFMPIHPREHTSRVVRRVKTVRGEIRFRVRCAPRFDYARAEHTRARAGERGIVFTGADGTVLRLSSTVPLRIENGDAVGDFTLRAGETATFILEQVAGKSAYPTDLDAYVTGSFKETMNFWREWIGRSTYTGRWRDEVHRSALALKLLNARWSGSIVAAATFGLPETIGGGRNWDYRYSWIRDASFTLYALTRLGMTDGDRRVHRLAGRALRVLPPGDAPDALHHRRRSRPDRADAGPSGGLSGLAPGPDRQRRRPTSCSSTSTASCSTRSTCTTSTGRRPATISGDGSPRWWTG